MIIVKKNRIQLIIILIILLILVGCQTKTYEKIDPADSVIFTLNKGDYSVSIIDIDSYEEITRWMLDFTFSGAILLPDEKTLVFYGKDESKLYFIDSSTGKLQQTKTVPLGINNGILTNGMDQLIFTNQLNDTVLFYDLEGKLLEEIAVQKNPSTMVQTADGKQLFVYNFSSATISALDIPNKETIRTFEANDALFGGIVNESKKELWVGGHGGSSIVEQYVHIYSIESGELLSKVEAPYMPVAFEKNSQGDIFVLSHGTNELRRFSEETGELTGSLIVGSNPLGIVTDHSTLFIASYDKHEISIVDGDSMELIKEIEVGKSPFQILLRKGESQ